MNRQRILKYFTENPPAIYILGFMVLLISCAFILASSPSNTTPANDVAIYAYYLLVLGVFLQFIQLTREGKKPLLDAVTVVVT